MNTAAKPAPPKKKAAPRMSLIKYAEKCLKPRDGFIAHPLYHNNPDKLQVFSRKPFVLHTGLEIAVPPNMVLSTSINVQGVVQVRHSFTGYQKELCLELYNLTDTVIEINPYQLIGNCFLTEIKSWRQ